MAVTAVSAEHLTKVYKLYPHPRARLRELFTGKPAHTPYKALDDVSFALEKGDCLGIVGDNGAGKSTLLKIVAGTLKPTQGKIRRHGRVTAILELGAGFHPEFSGRDNVFFASSLMGIPRREVASRFEAIVAFAELEDVIDRPVKTYSSGMFVRLAFALMVSLDPEILVVDEALAVGDQHFQKKCIDRMTAFREEGGTLLFCSHSLYHIRHLCSRALWIHQGQAAALGPVEDVLAAYEDHVRSLNAPSQGQEHHAPTTTPLRAGLKSVSVKDIRGDGLLVSRDLTIEVVAQVDEGEVPHIGVLIERSDGVWVYGVSTHMDGVHPRPLGKGRWRAAIRFDPLPLLSGEYWISAYLFDSTALVVYEEWLKCKRFRCIRDTREVGLVRLAHEWS